MKNKYLMLIIIGLVLLGLALLLVYFFGANPNYIIAICTGAFVVGLSVKLIKAFLIPPQWLFDHRFGFEGLLFVFPMLLILSSTHDYVFSIKGFTYDLVFGCIFGYFIMGHIYKSNHIRKINTIVSNKINIERPMLADLAFYKEGNSTILGKLILTEEKLFFLPADTDIPTTEIDLPEQKQSVRIRKNKFGLPNGIIINENLHLSLSYPKLWIKKINAA